MAVGVSARINDAKFELAVTAYHRLDHRCFMWHSTVKVPRSRAPSLSQPLSASSIYHHHPTARQRKNYNVQIKSLAWPLASDQTDGLIDVFISGSIVAVSLHAIRSIIH